MPAQAIIAPLSVQSLIGGATRGATAAALRAGRADRCWPRRRRPRPASSLGAERQRIAAAVDQHVADRALERGAEIGDRLRVVLGGSFSTVWRTAVFRPEKEKSQPGLRHIGRGRAKRCGSPPLRRALDRRPAGKAEAQQLGGLVEAFAGRVVDGRAEPRDSRPARARSGAGNGRPRPAAADRESRPARSAAPTAHGLRGG